MMAESTASVEDMAMLIRRLCYCIKRPPLVHANALSVVNQAMDYLKRHGLEGSIVRTVGFEDAPAAPLGETK